MKANVSQEPSIPTQCSVRLTSADPVHSYPRKQAHQINYSVSHAPSIHISNAANGLEVPLPRRKSTGTLMSDAMKPVLNTSDQESIDMLDDAGMIIARYKLGNTIGKGHFGTVYRALELCTGRMVAVKRIKLDDARKEDIDDVLQEAELLQSLMHPNIVKYEGFIQSAEHINIVLEFVENGSLLNTLKHFGSFPENLVANYCLRILEGLNYLHERDVVHCDLKAANILTTKTGDVKLSDFGVSLNLKLKEANAGAVAGTPNWMPPEVIELKGASTKSDIWSLGCTVIELCTGKPPYANLIPMTALFRIVEDDCPPLPEDVSDVCNSPTFVDFVQRKKLAMVSSCS
ncbi:kinase-like domain-containing protein [Radiomyces spectabilis]|uniref:kinase-like domain-containing protein n=1 Tax=Radiomyces spectabilis TaxID=64574 RepID=UPI00221F41D6|nr:kinase-like domain-containing protein [Radiomyces spectabilis]KAI8394150.1 kinase-like domain-containing protein [Radiomyces spectabilis]